MTKQRIFVTRKIPECGINLLKKHFTVEVFSKDRAISRKELDAKAAKADALLCLLTETIDQKFLEKHNHLKIIANYAVGYNNIDVAAAQKQGVVVTNTPGVLDGAVAEHTIALLFAAAKRLVEADSFTRKGKYKGWKPMLLLGSEVHGKTLGIVGTGNIGSGVAQRACALGLKVLYYDLRKNPAIEKRGAKKVSLNTLLKKSDFVSLHVPLFPSTRHLIGAAELKLMKSSAYLINTSRGPVVDEKALVTAVRRKQIAGAALDVFEFEPTLSKGLSTLDTVILTPHIASATTEARDAMAILAAKNIIAVLKGKKAITPVRVK